jgi:hypothetical protein
MCYLGEAAAQESTKSLEISSVSTDSAAHEQERAFGDARGGRMLDMCRSFVALGSGRIRRNGAPPCRAWQVGRSTCSVLMLW